MASEMFTFVFRLETKDMWVFPTNQNKCRKKI